MELAFDAAAGFNASHLNLFVRSMIASLFTIWAVWVAYKQYQLMVAEKMSSGDWFFNVVKVFVVLVIVLVIVSTA